MSRLGLATRPKALAQLQKTLASKSHEEIFPAK
jgi:hypothetical protein